ncbi:HD-GYP domain-containing protein [Rhodoferax sp. PAMC 29310]|uniref:HD-GYP domain-containing protein n=1 Tax=Rhodoferax sp. PAMC 29310 TaxID=2822760 RepID=UPI001F0B70BD|nr:HD domain-containing phosphohydrolase [Rhodoferax sp. PAMC 29310]
MKVLRLPRAKVKVGMPLPWNVRDEQGLLLLSKGHVITNESQLEQLLTRGAFVDVEEIKASAREAAEAADALNAVKLPPNLFARWDQTSEALKKLLGIGVRLPDFPEQLDEFARQLCELIDINADVATYRIVRQDNAKHFYYGYAHSVHTAILSVLMARYLKWEDGPMMSLVKAALTMNLSILDLQGQMAGQDGPMKDSQRAAIQKHPGEAVELLEKAGVTDTDWLTAVAQHHERQDGTGYPLQSTEIGDLAVALRVADVLMAKISPRALRAALSPQEAIRELYREDKGGPISTAVIKVLGIFPPGDFVKLASGELGIVVERTANARAPIVAAITNTSGQLVSTTLRRDTSAAAYAIVGNASDKALLKRLPPERLYGYALSPTAVV